MKALQDPWSLWLLADSALHTGGFVSSCGLESAHQFGRIQNAQDLFTFVLDSCHNYCHSMLPFIERSCRLCSQLAESDIQCVIQQLVQLDKELDTMLQGNHVARRASLAQGIAYTTLMSRSFSHLPSYDIIKLLKKQIHSGK